MSLPRPKQESEKNAISSLSKYFSILLITWLRKYANRTAHNDDFRHAVGESISRGWTFNDQCKVLSNRWSITGKAMYSPSSEPTHTRLISALSDIHGLCFCKNDYNITSGRLVGLYPSQTYAGRKRPNPCYRCKSNEFSKSITG